ncbi:MAG: ribonuclease Y [Candidatus Omnitrophica bacterium]|nr:ribonuclease Y [Candidatus Omnitrophota bacterium]
MLTNIYVVVSIVIIVGALSFIVGYVTRRRQAEGKMNRAEKIAKRMLDDAQKEAKTLLKEAKLEARDQLYKSRIEFDKESKDRRLELSALEKRLVQKEENLDRKVDLLDKKEKDLSRKERQVFENEKVVRDRQKELDGLIDREKEELQRIAGLSLADAKNILLKRIEDDVRYEASVFIKKTEDDLKMQADRKAQEIISTAIARCAADYTVERTVTVVNLPSDEMKGRIIGREGRNIRALEQATGVDIIIDDTPEAVVISGFDAVRREVARLALEKLIVDGRIHPARIEDVCEKTKKEMEKRLVEQGEAAVLETGLMGIHPEIVKLLGRLHYRTSYGQNVLLHSLEAASIMATMAAELGLNIKVAKRIGLLHDIGKAVDYEIEGSHAVIGADLAKKCGENPGIVYAIRGHHHDVEPQNPYDVLIEAADAVSAARPGVRGETVETYIQRLEKLESIANAFRGINRSYAIQAGRELRVIVEPEKVNDAEAAGLARDISKAIQAELEYPGQIKVTVIREVRSVDYAK